MRIAWHLLLPLALALPLAAAEATLVRVWSGHRTAESFERISEYFTGQENPGNQTIVRTQPGHRAGYYWLMRTACPAPVTAARIELAVTQPGTEAPVIYTLTTDLPAGSHVTLAGLTGSDWPDAGSQPTAWRLRILAPDGTTLAREQSFLWTTTTAARP